MNLDQLEQIALAATPGPWMTPDHALSIHRQEAPCTAVAFTMTKSGSCENHEANASHIAAFDPPTALKLLAVVRAAREAEAALAVGLDYTRLFHKFETDDSTSMSKTLKALRAALQALTQGES